jgi:ElaB/YqjD/DUF883 family membrane-anchored ribosome-binding protein
MMSTATASTRTKANGASRQVKAISRRAATQTRQLSTEIKRETRAIGARAGQLFASASRATRQHPWTAASVVAAGVALVGGYLWASRRR